MPDINLPQLSAGLEAYGRFAQRQNLRWDYVALLLGDDVKARLIFRRAHPEFFDIRRNPKRLP